MRAYDKFRIREERVRVTIPWLECEGDAHALNSERSDRICLTFVEDSNDARLVIEMSRTEALRLNRELINAIRATREVAKVRA